MDHKDRIKILNNLPDLVKVTRNFNYLVKALVEKEMFNEFMIKEIMSNSKDERVMYLFKYLTTRGPAAFIQLQNALIETGNTDAASILKGGARPLPIMHNGGPEEEEEVDEEILTVIKGMQRMDLDRQLTYKNCSRPRGHVLIVNIRSYANNIEEERLGSEEDVKALKTVFTQLDYITHVVPNEQLKKSELIDEVKRFSTKAEHKDCDSGIVVIMTHGNTDESSLSVRLKCYDGQEVLLEELIDMFTASICKGLAGKPKLFFIQTCRGTMPLYKIPEENGKIDNAIQTDGAIITPPSKVNRNCADMLISHATVHGYVSYRDIVKGSWFIQALCESLAQHAHNKDLSTILEIVHRRMRDLDPDIIISTRKPGFNKKFYFNPGYSDERSPLAISGS